MPQGSSSKSGSGSPAYAPAATSEGSSPAAAPAPADNKMYIVDYVRAPAPAGILPCELQLSWTSRLMAAASRARHADVTKGTQPQYADAACVQPLHSGTPPGREGAERSTSSHRSTNL